MSDVAMIDPGAAGKAAQMALAEAMKPRARATFEALRDRI